MRMAKDQGLPLNPMKISGVCGRLMCCLVYENEYYQEMKGILPRNGQRVITPGGDGKVVDSNPLKVSVMVELESMAVVEYPLNQITLEGEARHEQPKDHITEKVDENNKDNSNDKEKNRVNNRVNNREKERESNKEKR
jgi:hypothetical protein